MKLYFVVDYIQDAEDDCNYISAGNNLIGNTHSNRSVMIHPHENYIDLSHFIKYRVFRDQFRYAYRNYEHQLVEVPDELVFQYMMVGLQENDYIVYNVQTKRIVMGNDLYDCRELANKSPKRNSNSGNYPKAVGRVGGCSYNTNAMFDFNQYDEEDEIQREDILVEFDSSNGYAEMSEVLMPFVYNLYIRETKVLCDFLGDHPGVGKCTIRDGGNSDTPMDEDECASYSNNIRILRVAQVPGNSAVFVFESYMDNHELWVKTQHQFNTYEKETLRKFSTDILTKFHENTGNSAWDVRK